ncbi:MAG TPA: TolC family protein [Thermoanaerobaculia bacterium]
MAQTPALVTPPPPPPTPPPTPPTVTAPPLSIASASQLALQQASAYQQAVIDEQIAELEVTQARAAIFPKIRSTSTVMFNKPLARASSDPSFIAQNASREYQSLVGAEGTFDFGLRAAMRRSRELLAAAKAGTEIARRELVRGVREAYFGMALATAKRRSAEEALAAAQEFERVTALQHEGGEVPEVDAIRARLQTAQRRDDLEQAVVQETISAAAMRILVGYKPADSFSVLDLSPTPSSADIETFTFASTAGRPEIVQASAQERAARADVGVARAERLPSLTYSADEGFDSPTLHDIHQHTGYLLSANLRIPIFDWGVSRAHERQAELRADQAANLLTLARRDAEQQYLRAREEALASVRRADNARTAVADARRNVDISIARYRAGEAPIVEVTDALTTLAQLRTALQQALFDFEVARAQLQEAAGQ